MADQPWQQFCARPISVLALGFATWTFFNAASFIAKLRVLLKQNAGEGLDLGDFCIALSTALLAFQKFFLSTNDVERFACPFSVSGKNY